MTAFARALRAELVRIGGGRSPVVRAALPIGVLLPLIVTFGVAAVAERFARLPGQIQVTSVQTTNAVYWVIVFTAMTWTVVAATGSAAASRGATSDLQRHLFPRPWTGALARWLVYGVLGAATSLVLVVVVLLVLPAAFGTVYGAVDIASSDGVRFLFAVPWYTFVATGLGVGLGTALGHPAVSAAVILAWALLVENAIALVPNGYTLQGYMPFLNGQFGTGQELAFTPDWGRGGGLIYFTVVAVVVVCLGCLAQYRRTVRDG